MSRTLVTSTPPSFRLPSNSGRTGSRSFLLPARTVAHSFGRDLPCLFCAGNARTSFALSVAWTTTHHAGHQPLQLEAGSAPDGKQIAPRGSWIENFNSRHVCRAGTRRIFTTYGGVRLEPKSARLTTHGQQKPYSNNDGQRNNLFGPTMATTSTRRRSNGGTYRPTYLTFAQLLRLRTTRCC